MEYLQWLPSAAWFLVASGLHLSGWTSVPVAVACWVVAFVMLAWAGWHWLKTRYGRSGVESSDFIILGLVGIALFAIIAAIGVGRQHFRPSQTISPGGASGTVSHNASAETSPSEIWNSSARLVLTFDTQLQAASASRQEGVRFYYWYHFPGVGIDFEKWQTQAAPGYIVVFLSLKDPTYTNYSRVRVVGGGILCEIQATHAAGAVVRAMGDMRGRTLDIWFSKDTIPVD
jgi:hypothetical protein